MHDLQAYSWPQLHADRQAELERTAERIRRSRAVRDARPPGARRRTGSVSLVRAEARLFLRDVPSAVFALAVPALLLVGVGLAIPGMDVPIADPGGGWDGLTMVQAYTPTVLTMVIATPALSTLPVVVANYREHGVQRRLATTPMRPRGVLLAQVTVNVTALAVASVLALAAAAAVFAAPAPRQPATAALSLLAGAAATFGLGVLIAARARKGSTASGIGMLLYFPLLFLAGMWTPGPLMPDLVRDIATYTPLGAASQALTTAWFDTGFPALQLTVLAAWTALLYPLAAKVFRWT